MKTAQSPVAYLEFDETESILYVKMLNAAKVTIENSKLHSQQIENITGGKPYLALIDIGNFLETNDEALLYSAMRHHLPNRIAAAYYNPNLANRLALETYRKNSNLAFSVSIFNNRAEALEWLKQQRK